MARFLIARRVWLILVLLGLLFSLGALQVWSAIATRDVVSRALAEQAPAGLADLDREKARQELIGKEIENNSKALLQNNLVSALGAALGVVISVSGGLIAVFGYIDAREKERVDRLDAETRARDDRLHAEDKARRDSLASSLGATLTALASTEFRQRMVGAAGLLPFFAPERAEFHLQALAPLVALAKNSAEPPEVLEGVRVAVEQAARTVDHGLMAKLSWRRVQLPEVNLAGCDLSNLDFRDAILTEAVLDGAKLGGANLTAAKLQGASLNGADLASVNLTYADLAGASLKAAVLRGAALDNVGILNLDLQGADLSLVSGWRGAPWDVTRNWRRATFDPETRQALDKVYGSEVPPIKILMLLWETPPFVAGGSWTAAYHLVRKLRRRGAEITVVTPWRRDLMPDYPFGLDVALVGLGITPPASAGPGGYDAYGGYGSRPPGSTTYGSYSTYGSYGSYGMGDLLGSVLYVLMGEYRSRLVAFLAEQKFDIVHGHDWVTFDAARAAAGVLGAPWVAHFHSLEIDRNPFTPDILTQAIERASARQASAVAAPSEATRRRIASAYSVDLDGIVVAPNVLSEETIFAGDAGAFESRRIVFVGRVAQQKGVDRFEAVGRSAGQRVRPLRFEIVGGGDGVAAGLMGFATRREALPWSRRGEAFRDATAVVMPSRSEPFGMVVLEAMQHRVPVLYPEDSGAAEVLQSGLKVDPADIEQMSQAVVRLATDQAFWETTVRDQAAEIADYPLRGFEDALVALWSRVIASNTVGSTA